MNRTYKCWVLRVALALCTARALLAQEPMIPFQGYLSDADGDAIDGVRSVQFRLYDAPVGGTVLWSGEVHKLSVNKGVVNTILGSKSSLSNVEFDRPVYLEITVDADEDSAITAADPPLLPRQIIIASVFAQQSGNTALLEGYSWSSILDHSKSGGISNPENPAARLKASLFPEAGIDLDDLAEAVASRLVPSGTIVAFAGLPEKVPEGWELCDGARVDGSDPRFAALREVLGETWGNGSSGTLRILNGPDYAGNGTQLFNLPDTRGLFLRGLDDAVAGRDLLADRRTNLRAGSNSEGVGSFQDDHTRHPRTSKLVISTNAAGSHTHVVKIVNSQQGGGGNFGWGSPNHEAEVELKGNAGSVSTAGNHTHSGNTTGVGGDAETTPKNVAVAYIIKL